MLVVVIRALLDAADAVDCGVVEPLLFGECQHLLPFGRGEKFSVGVEQFQGVPLAGIVRRGDDDAAVGMLRNDGHLRAGRGAQPHVDDVGARGQQRTLDQIGDQPSRNACVAPHDDAGAASLRTGSDQAYVGRGELHDVGRRQILARRASDRTPDARNGLDECHVPESLYGKKLIPINKKKF